jgi:hypothetical protein
VKPVYAVLLPFVHSEGVADRAWELALQWVSPDGRIEALPGTFTVDVSDGERARLSTVSHGAASVRRLDRMQEPSNESPRGWRTSLWVCDDGSRAWGILRGGPETQAGYVTTFQFEAFRPRIVGDWITEVGAAQDGRRLDIKALSAGVGDKEWVLELLTNPRRHLPVIGVSLPPGPSPKPLLNVHHLASRMAGNAHVIVLTRQLSWELTSELGPEMSVFNGAARVWWPQFRLTDVVQRHQLLMPDLVRVWRAAADGSGPPTLEVAVRARSDRQQAERQMAELRSSRAADEEFFSAFEEQLDRNSVLQEDLEEAHSQIEDLRAALAAAEAGVEDDLDEDPPEVESVRDAVALAAAEAVAVVYLPQAYESGAESEYSNPQQVLRDLRALNRVAARWASGELPHGFEGGFRDEAVLYRPGIGQTASTKYQSDYEIVYAGQKVMMGPHLRRGTGPVRSILRIYWYVDGESRQFVVGHVGRKLRDRSNP